METKKDEHKDEIVHLQVSLKRELHRKFKSQCAAQGITMNQQIEQLIEAFLKIKTRAA